MRKKGKVHKMTMPKIECDPTKVEVAEPVFPSEEMRGVMGARWDEFKTVFSGSLTEHVTSERGGSHRHMHIRRGGKVLGVAHLDSVQEFTHFWVDKRREYMGCPTLDNRLGAWVLLYGLKHMGITLDVLLCDEEEHGSSTAQDFKLPDGVTYNWMVSFDRTGDDCVMYQYDDQWDKEVLKSFGIKAGHGSYSDIDSAGHLGILGMNMGCGMYNYHSREAYCKMHELSAQMKRFAAFYKVYADTKLEYEQKQWNRFRRTRNKGTTTNLWSPRESHDEEEYWKNWRLETREDEERREKERLAKAKQRYPLVDYSNLETIYVNFWMYGLNCQYFNHQHPVTWCSTHGRSKTISTQEANRKGLIQCGRCQRYFEEQYTEYFHSLKDDFCRYCYLTEAEGLDLLPKDWYELATSMPETIINA